jgi:NAD(P)-dependent dehydrogenase (short-subunit alcohol dehydrogenase family)
MSVDLVDLVDLDGKVAIVTGAGGGIGRATAHQLAQQGASVVVNDIGTSTDGLGQDFAKADAVAEEIRAAGGKAAPNHDSVSDFDAAANIIETALREFGGVDILVNNAGLAARGELWELDAEDFERVTASHIKGTFNCSRHAVSHMKDKGWGRIVNLVSRAGIIGMPGSLAYGTGKGGVFGFTNVTSRDLGRFGITVNAVNPASTETRMVTQATDRMQGADEATRARIKGLLAAMQKPERVAVLIGTLCTEAAADINGQIFLVQKNHIGLFQPLTVTQSIDREQEWTAADLGEALAGLKFHPLDDPYA